MMKEKKKTFFI